MSDKLASPSSSSNGGGTTTSSNQTPPHAQRNKSGPAVPRDENNYLEVRQQPPTYVFADEIFDIYVGLEVTRLTADSPPTGTAVELTACLLSHPSNDATAAAEAAAKDIGHLVLLGNSTSPDGNSNDDNNNHTVSTSKPCRLRCKIQLLDSNNISPLVRRDKRLSCLISISARDGVHGIASTTTTVIHVVNYKLRIAMDSNWSNIWYKDEGGRDKSMEVVAELYSHDNVQHRERIPLRLTLYYSPQDGTSDSGSHHDLVKVTNQEILRSLGSSSKLYTDKSTGKATVRFRIEDVSKNHQGQDFVLQIAPDYRKGFLDVAPGLTPSVSVRSKRNKRQRTSTAGGGRSERRGSSPVEHSHTSSGDGGRSVYAEQPGRSVWGQEGIATTDPARLREAIQSIVHWTEEVVNGLYPLQWQILGYAQRPDGSPDYSRPHYSMNNPNACISRVLATYAESTRENLWVLSQAVEQAANNQVQPGSRDAYGRHSPDNSYAVPPPHTLPPPAHAHATAHTPPGMIPPPQAAAAMGGISVPGGMHPSIASEAFRPKMPMGEPHPHQYSHGHQATQQHHGVHMPYASPQGRGHPQAYPPSQHAMHHPYYQRQMPTQSRRVLNDSESNLQPEPFPPASIQAIGDAGSPPSHRDSPSRLAQQAYRRQDVDARDDLQSRESEVEFVLAKEYKALRTGERLGFPAYTSSREIVGFYRESRTKVGVGEFTPISRHSQDFGPMEIMQASEILEEAIAKKSSAVHALKDWGSIANLIDHALVYDWTKDISATGGTGHSQSGSEEGE